MINRDAKTKPLNQEQKSCLNRRLIGIKIAHLDKELTKSKTSNGENKGNPLEATSPLEEDQTNGIQQDHDYSRVNLYRNSPECNTRLQNKS